jgi:hypothetical protein
VLVPARVACAKQRTLGGAGNLGRSLPEPPHAACGEVTIGWVVSEHGRYAQPSHFLAHHLRLRIVRITDDGDGDGLASSDGERRLQRAHDVDLDAILHEPVSELRAPATVVIDNENGRHSCSHGYPAVLCCTFAWSRLSPAVPNTTDTSPAVSVRLLHSLWKRKPQRAEGLRLLE